MSTTRPNEAQITSQCQTRILGITKYVTGNASITLDGKPYTSAQIVAVYQACIDTRQTVTSQRTALSAALTARDQADALRASIDTALEHWVENTLGTTSPAMGGLGYATQKSAPRTLKSKVVAADKALATRKARGTMGKREKEAIKGELPAQAVSAPAVVSKPNA